MERLQTKAMAIFVSTIFILGFLLAGCAPIDNTHEYSTDTAGPMNCIIIYSNHANSKADTDSLEKYVRGAKEANGYLNFVRLDGNPSAIYKSNDAQTSTESSNPTNIEAENEIFVRNRMQELEAISAEADEVDVFGAIETANRYLGQASNKSLENVVVFVGTGLSTTGKIDFTTETVTSSFLEDYRTWIVKEELLPKLEHVDRIVWCGFDQVAKPQDEFPNEKIKKDLRGFYQSLFKSLDVETIEFQDSGSEKEPNSNHHVTSVKFPPPREFRPGDKIDIDADVLFEANLAVFRADTDPSTNEDIVDAANAIKNKGYRVKVTGYIAHYGDPNDKTLCLARAEAVKSLLVEKFGCPPENITTEGGGFGPYDTDEQNRCVQITFE